MVFQDIVVGWPGSVHDSRVLRNSGLYQTAAIKFPGDTHLLGDGGYPLLRSVDFVIFHILKYMFTQKLQPYMHVPLIYKFM